MEELVPHRKSRRPSDKSLLRSIPMNLIPANITPSQLQKWFEKQGFTQAAFQKNREYVTNYSGGRAIAFRLTRREGFETFYKGAYGGSLLVFEVAVQNGQLSYDCYCPLWLFGIWTIKLAFKPDAGGIFRYRKEGHQVEEKFKRFLEKKNA